MHNPGNVEYAPHGTHFEIALGSVTHEATIGYEGVVAVILDEDGELCEWITEDAPREYVANVATQGRMVALDWDCTVEPDNIAIARHARELYADCFGTA